MAKDALLKKILKFIRESKEELGHVSWPDRDEVTSFTGVVIVAVIIIAVFLWVVDSALVALTKVVM